MNDAIVFHGRLAVLLLGENFFLRYVREEEYDIAEQAKEFFGWAGPAFETSWTGDDDAA